MDFSLSEDQQSLQALARRILGARSPFADDASYPPEGWFDADAWRELSQSNLLGVALPESVNGLGLGLTELALVLEEAGRALTCAPLVPALVSAGLAIAEFGSPRQQEELLTGLVDGQHLLTAALTEPGSHDPLAVHTDAVPTSGGYALTGEKTAVPMADRAERILVPARLPDGGLLLLLVRPDTAGVTTKELATSSGEPQFALSLDDVSIAAEDVLTGPDEGRDALRWIVDRTSLGLAAVQLGVAETELEVTAAYTSQREQFNRPIATFQSVACRVADSFVDTRAMRGTLQQALWLLDNGRTADREVTIAKFWAAEAGERIATQSVYLHGGIGVDTDYPLHHYFLASKLLELQLGGASWQVDKLGKQLAAGVGA